MDETVILPNDIVTVTQMNHIIEVQYMAKMNTQISIRKLDKHHYVDLETGEIKEFELSENRADNVNSLRQTFKKLRYLINNNFEGKPNELHIILTYAENMTDPKVLYEDFKNFMKRLKYHYRKETTIDYISVVEPQGRGAWHCHVLMRFNKLPSIYIPNDQLNELWGNGFVMIKALNDVDNIGAYLSAYLTDIELEPEKTEEIWEAMKHGHKEIKEVKVNGKDKMMLKGGRLHMYPPGMNLYRKSKGIEYPERNRMTYKKAKKIVGSAQPHYLRTYKIESDDFENSITFQQYNLKRTNVES